jgi:transposase
MAKYKPYNYDQSLLMPICLQDQLIPGTIEFAIHHLVDTRLDLSLLDSRFNNDETGRPAYDPRVLLKIVLVAYTHGIVHSRKIEQACRENSVFVALTCGQVPDHTTIATFISSMKDEIRPLFRDILLVCDEMNLLDGTTFALDGCKLPANASKEWSGTHETLRKKQHKLEEKVSELMERQIRIDEENNLPQGESTERQIERLQKKADRIREFLGDNDIRIGRMGKEIKSNITDNESCYMKTSHGMIQGYNAHSLVTKTQVIIDAQAFGEGQDYAHVAPMLAGAKENLQAIGYEPDCLEGKELVADSNYHSETNLKVCEKENLNAYIPDVYFRKRDSRFETQSRHKPETDRFTLADFTYDEGRDIYTCPKGKELKLSARRSKAKDWVFRRYVMKDGACSDCEHVSKCLEERGGKHKHLNIPVERQDSLHLQMMRKIDTEKGRMTYEKRLGMIEPVFANIRTHKRLDRFTLRGKIKVNIQWMLYCMVHNIGKLVREGYGRATA